MPPKKAGIIERRPGSIVRYCYSLLAVVMLSYGLSTQTQTSAASIVQFTNVTSTAAIQFVHYPGNKGMDIIREVMGPGVCVSDFDGDGWQDIYFVNGRDLYNRGISTRNALYRHNGDGTFTDITEKAGVAGTGYGLGCVWGDYDNDGRPDLFVTQYGANVLYHNNGDGTFADVTRRAGVAGADRVFHSGATFFDYDRDVNSRYLAVVSNVGHASSTELASPIDPSLSYFTPGYAVPSWAARLGGITEAARKNLFVGFPNLEPDGDAQTSMALIAPGISGSKELQESLMRIAGRPKGLNTPFPLSGLGQQLRQVASLLKVVPGLGISRPIFVCTLGGFATSSEQLPKQAELFRELSTAMASFHEATVELGISQRVTTYTDSEFSRTLQPNKYNGSDPAWGGHHLVMGGSVLGGQVHGNFPVLQLGGPSDASRNGTWVPTSSKDQYAATLANWYGIQQGHLSTYLPDVVRHAKPTLGFMAG